MSEKWDWERFALDYDREEDSRDLSATSAGFRRLMADLAWQHLHELEILQNELTLQKQLAAGRGMPSGDIRSSQQLLITGVPSEKPPVLGSVAACPSMQPPTPQLLPTQPPALQLARKEEPPPGEIIVQVEPSRELPSPQVPSSQAASKEAPQQHEPSPNHFPRQTELLHSATDDEKGIKAELAVLQNDNLIDDEGDDPIVGNANTFLGRLKTKVFRPEVDLFMANLILINVLFIALEMQYDGFDFGYDLGFPGYDAPSRVVWPAANVVFRVAEWIFTLLFTVDISLRILLLGKDFWKVAMNWVDFVVVVTSLTELLWSEMMETMVLRMLRLTKLTRSLRLLNMANVLEALRMIMRCLTASVGTLFWSLFVLFIIQCIGAMLVIYSTQRYMLDENEDIELRRLVFKYYGNFSRCMLTMFEILFANWIVPCRVLVDHVSEYFSAVFILYRCLIGFAVLNVVNAVFIQRTMKVAQDDQEFIVQQKQQAAESFSLRLEALFKELDTSGDGSLTWEEFSIVIQDVRIAALLESMEVDTNDLARLFSLLDNGDGAISPQEFSHGILTMKGQAKSIDVASILQCVKRIHSQTSAMQIQTASIQSAMASMAQR
eukprot:TRINITY_DN106892_c0_g1_i1.p1 TRINITY_DN106892_c0_g1~~TRINITY_DN106892_c0_g1_i1.p1  ORF type:complete len:606 (-),score=111.03 TRINITY_DN106892_c0_g1_i1:97-1914(-)